VKELQPKASQRAIADLVGASPQSIGRDLGTISTVPSGTKNMDFGPDFVPFGTPPAIPPDDFNPIEQGKLADVTFVTLSMLFVG
jgi:hypothetical protein